MLKKIKCYHAVGTFILKCHCVFHLPANIYLFKVNPKNTEKVWNMFKVNKNNTKATSTTSF